MNHWLILLRVALEADEEHEVMVVEQGKKLQVEEASLVIQQLQE